MNRKSILTLKNIMMRAALLALLFAPCAAAEQPEPEIHAVLPDLSGTWLATTETSSVLSLYRHQPTSAAAAVPNAVYARELDGKHLGHCWSTPSYDYSSRGLQHIEFTCDGGDRGLVTTVDSSSSSSSTVLLSISGVDWRRSSLVPAPHNATIHTVHMIYMNHYDVGPVNQFLGNFFLGFHREYCSRTLMGCSDNPTPRKVKVHRWSLGVAACYFYVC